MKLWWIGARKKKKFSAFCYFYILTYGNLCSVFNSISLYKLSNEFLGYIYFYIQRLWFYIFSCWPFKLWRTAFLSMSRFTKKYNLMAGVFLSIFRNSPEQLLYRLYFFLDFLLLTLTFVSTIFLLVCFLSLNESTFQTRKSLFYLTLKAFFNFEKMKFKNSTFSYFMTSNA